MKTLTAFIIIVLTLPTFAQVSTFSKFFGKDSFYCSGPTVIASGDSIVLLGLFYGYNTQGHLFIKTDINGVEAYRFVNGKSDTFFSGHYALCANRTSTNHFILSGQVARSGAQVAYDALYKLRSNLDTEYVRTLNTASGCSYLPFATELSDKNYLLAGYRQDCIINANYIAALIKTDTLGNIIWVKEEPHPNHSGFTCTGAVSKAFYVIDEIVTDANTGDSLIQIHKYDNDGNLIWKKNFGHFGFNNVTGPLIATHDGGVIYVLNTLDTNAVIGDPTYSMPSIIYRLDSTGNIIWQKWLTYGNFTSLHETKSGAIVFSENLLGLPFDSTLLNYDFSGALFKLGPDGHTIWQQYFKNGVDTSYDNYFFDVTEGTDGGIFATGQAVPLNGQRNQIWLVKVDSNGCLNGNCPQLFTGIQEEERPTDILIFPNPAQSQFTVAFGETLDFRRYREPVFELTDVTGRIVLQRILTEQATSFSCSAFAQGVYVYTIRSEGRFVAEGKIIIK
ncbi:MAG: T9SS type A sorting domain-containing protein [Bacteroidetes bacterium]|nr:T9SS type A sorting domain-containing protein [Bacteroidota bacterium]